MCECTERCIHPHTGQINVTHRPPHTRVEGQAGVDITEMKRMKGKKDLTKTNLVIYFLLMWV